MGEELEAVIPSNVYSGKLAESQETPECNITLKDLDFLREEQAPFFIEQLKKLPPNQVILEDSEKSEYCVEKTAGNLECDEPVEEIVNICTAADLIGVLSAEYTKQATNDDLSGAMKDVLGDNKVPIELNKDITGPEASTELTQ